MTPFGPFAAFIKGCITFFASSGRNGHQLASSQGIKLVAIERPRASEKFVSFRALCDVQSSPLAFPPNPCVRVWSTTEAGALIAYPQNLLSTLVNPARGLLNREKRTKGKVSQRPSPRDADRSEKIK